MIGQIIQTYYECGIGTYGNYTIPFNDPGWCYRFGRNHGDMTVSPGADTNAHRIDGDDQHDAYLAVKHGLKTWFNHTANQLILNQCSPLEPYLAFQSSWLLGCWPCYPNTFGPCLSHIYHLSLILEIHGLVQKQVRQNTMCNWTMRDNANHRYPAGQKLVLIFLV